MRLKLSIAVTVLAMAAMAVFPTTTVAQIQSRVSTRNTLLSRYVPAYLKPEVRSGRITGTSIRRSSTQRNSSSESLSIQTDGSTGRMELKYEGPLREGVRVGGKIRESRMSVLLDTAARLEIELTLTPQSKTNTPKQNNKNNQPAADSNRSDQTQPQRTVVVGFMQRPDHRLTLTLAGGSKPRVIQATTIWELLIGHREECRANLLPILYKLRPGWNLLSTADQIESHLLQMANENAQPQYARWQKLVEQLGHDSYSRRESADRDLRDAGHRVLAFLTKLDKDKLDAEQRFRISRIVRSLDFVEQSPREIAEEMRDDPSIWLAIASDNREPARQTAHAELKRLLKRPLDFDPAAPVATRNSQLDKIERSINPSK